MGSEMCIRDRSKVLGKIIQKRLAVLVDDVVSEAQCGFRTGRATTDMLFIYRQLQEKCREQHMPLRTPNVPNVEVLRRTDIWGIEAFIFHANLRWAGHVMRMEDTRFPKQMLYGELLAGQR